MSIEVGQSPSLNALNHEVTSPSANRYNCIAWAAGDQSRWWWPASSYYWPVGAPRERTLSAFLEAFETLGYVECESATLEPRVERIALYARDHSLTGQPIPTHAARQLADGRWTSKLGSSIDIVHSVPDDLAGPAYGVPVKFMRRDRSASL